jgi:hypothetical protein
MPVAAERLVNLGGQAANRGYEKMHVVEVASVASRVVWRLYIVFTFWSAFQVYWRRGKYIHLEFAPKRAKGNWEPRRLAFLRKFRRIAAACLAIRIACLAWLLVTA